MQMPRVAMGDERRSVSFERNIFGISGVYTFTLRSRCVFLKGHIFKRFDAFDSSLEEYNRQMLLIGTHVFASGMSHE